MPSSRFTGIDLSPRQIEKGIAEARDLGLSNIDLRAMSILDVDASFGAFDYIVCHGVFSWVQPHVQEKILEICRERLAPNGIAYVSYLSDASGGYQLYVRQYSITKGWLTSAPIRASGSIYGDVSTWPGDTFGIATLSANQVVLSWGSGVLVNNQFKSEIFSDVVTFGH